MSAPIGLGVWVAYASKGGGYDAILPRLADLGVSWIAPRAGGGGWNDPGLHARHLSLAHALGIGIYPWIYSYPTTVSLELAAFHHLIDEGADGVIVNAEVPWIGHAAGAQAFAAQLRAAIAGAWIAHAPMDYLDYHPQFPYAEFGALDAVMPQVYAWEHDDRGHRYHLAAVERMWSAWERRTGIYTPRYPIGCTYRPEVRGGKRLPPRAIDWVDDLSPLLTMRDAGLPVSLYSLEAAAPEVIALLGARKRADGEAMACGERTRS